MNPIKTIGICFAAFVIPMVLILSLDMDTIVKEDRKLGTLLYFKGG